MDLATYVEQCQQPSTVLGIKNLLCFFVSQHQEEQKKSLRLESTQSRQVANGRRGAAQME
jgi:hypothetical protein